MIKIKKYKERKSFTLLVFLMILVSTFILKVNALDNKLYFTNSEDRLYYNTEYYDDNVFLRHLDMVPGGSYTDELKIENKTLYTYKLYLKVNVDEQSEYANELLEHIKMTIYHNGKQIYNGFAKGEEDEIGTNLQNTIYIGEYEPDKESTLLVDTELLVTYSNTDNQEISYIDWEFVAEYEDLVLPISPDTGGNIFKENKSIKILVISLSLLLFLIIVLILLLERKKEVK